MAAKAQQLTETKAEDRRAIDRRLPYLAGAILIAALAYVLRVFMLDGQSLWYDEGVSLVMAPRDLTTITANAAADIHPPLYYYLLHFWTGLVGTSEFGGRYLSAIYGVLLVPVLYQIARRLFGGTVGLVSAFIAATAPFLIYYSQEARMYMQVTTLGAFSTYLFCRLTVPSLEGKAGSTRWYHWTLYCVATALTIYSHYFGFAVVIFQNLYFWLFSGQQRGLWRQWLAAQVVVGLSFLPWALVSLEHFASWPSISEPLTLGALLEKVFLVFSMGLSWDATATTARVLLFVIILASTLLFLAMNRRVKAARSYALLVLYGFTPILLIYGLSLRRPMYNPKFLLVATPAYYCALALGIVALAWAFRGLWLHFLGSRLRHPRFRQLSLALATIIALIALVGVSYTSYHSVSAYYFNPKYARDDYRGVVQHIDSHSQPGDAIVLCAPGQAEIFDYYYSGDIPRIPLPAQRPMDEHDTTLALQELTQDYERVWLVLWAVPEADPNGLIEGWLDREAFKSLNTWFGSIRLCLYTTGEPPASVKQDVNIRFGEHITLQSYEMGGPTVKPGDALPLTFNWTTSQPLTERYTVFIHVLDANQLICGQRDSEPSGGTGPTNSWSAGQTVVDRHALPILYGTPPGQYTIEMGLYDSQTGQRLPIIDQSDASQGDRYLFGPIQVGRALSPPDQGLLDIEHNSNAVFQGKLRLLGYSLTALGRPVDYVNYSPDDILHLTLFWQTIDRPGENLSAALRLQNAADAVDTTEFAHNIAAGSYPSAEWQLGEIIRDQHKIPLRGLQGQYELAIALRSDQSQETWSVEGVTTQDGYMPLEQISID